jgi:hypothetical protein
MSTDDKKIDQARQRAAALQAHLTKDKEFRDRWIGVFIGVLACFMALCTLLGNNVAKDALRLHIEANNVWNFFQAKNLRRQMVRQKIDDLTLEQTRDTAMSATARDAYSTQIASYRALDAQLTSDKARNEGLDELFAKGKRLEAERDVQFRKDPYFDWAQTFLQISIVLASVCLVTGTMWLLYVAGVLGALGVLLLIDGHWLLVHLPFLG